MALKRAPTEVYRRTFGVKFGLERQTLELVNGKCKARQHFKCDLSHSKTPCSPPASKMVQNETPCPRNKPIKSSLTSSVCTANHRHILLHFIITVRLSKMKKKNTIQTKIKNSPWEMGKSSPLCTSSKENKFNILHNMIYNIHPYNCYVCIILYVKTDNLTNAQTYIGPVFTSSLSS